MTAIQEMNSYIHYISNSVGLDETVFILLYLCRDLVVRWYFIYLLTDSVYYMLLPSVGSGVWWQLHGRPFFNNLHGGEHLWSPLSHSPLRQVWEEVGHSVVSMDTRGHRHSNSFFKQLYHVYSAKIFHRSTEYGKCAISMSVMFDFMIWYSSKLLKCEFSHLFYYEFDAYMLEDVYVMLLILFFYSRLPWQHMSWLQKCFQHLVVLFRPWGLTVPGGWG